MPENNSPEESPTQGPDDEAKKPSETQKYAPPLGGLFDTGRNMIREHTEWIWDYYKRGGAGFP